MPKIALRERQNFVFNNVFQITRKIFKRKNKIMKNLKRIFFRFAETVVKEEKSVTKKRTLKRRTNKRVLLAENLQGGVYKITNQ